MFWLKLALGLAAVLALLWISGPRDRLRPEPVKVDLPADPQVWLEAREAGIRPKVASHIHWAEHAEDRKSVV